MSDGPNEASSEGINWVSRADTTRAAANAVVYAIANSAAQAAFASVKAGAVGGIVLDAALAAAQMIAEDAIKNAPRNVAKPAIRHVIGLAVGAAAKAAADAAAGGSSLPATRIATEKATHSSVEPAIARVYSILDAPSIFDLPSANGTAPISDEQARAPVKGAFAAGGAKSNLNYDAAQSLSTKPEVKRDAPSANGQLEAGAASAAVVGDWKKGQPVVIPLHGIRTHAEWQRAFAEVAHQNNFACPLVKWSFGYFPLVRFVIPSQREAKIRWFRSAYGDLINDRRFIIAKDDTPSIVAHSFGTYILGYSLLRYSDLKFDKIILCGSILPRNFPWDKILERGQVNYVRNEYGIKDVWVRLVEWFIRGTGTSGWNGFAISHERLIQKEFLFDHSEYFDQGHMSKKWVPFLFLYPPKLLPGPVEDPIKMLPGKRPWALYFAVGMGIFSVGVIFFFWLIESSAR
jgi:hypothetical protein